MSDEKLPPPEAVLPHRAPFLFLDRILAVDARRCVSERLFEADESFFAGHFPGNPIVPGVILIEAMAQTLGYLALRQRPDHAVLLTGVEKCRIRRPVRPGQSVRFEVEIVRQRMQLVIAQGKAYVGETLCASARIKGFLGPRDMASVPKPPPPSPELE